MLALHDISVAFWHALLPEDEPIAMYPPRGERRSRIHAANETSDVRNETSIASLPGHMKGVLKEAGFAALKVCHQVYHCFETDSTAASQGDDIIAEGEPEKLDRLYWMRY